jgi:hypothetical protein
MRYHPREFTPRAFERLRGARALPDLTASARARVVLVAACLLTISSAAQAQVPDSTSRPLTFAIGADLSFLKAAEDRGVQFRDGGVARPALDIFRDHGYDWIRLRLFHTPTELPNSLAYGRAGGDAKPVTGSCWTTTTRTPGRSQHQITPRLGHGPRQGAGGLGVSLHA